MKPALKCITPKSVLRSLFITFIFNTIIAIFLSSIQFGEGFISNFIFSQCIGLSICSCVLIALHGFQKVKPIFQTIMVGAALLTGTLIGSFLGTLVSGLSTSDVFERHGLIQLLFLGVMFGSIITYIFSSRAQIADSEARIQEEKIKRLTSEKKVVEANLKLLQAQIEPHFLFNTLSNVLSLFETDFKDQG
jgi:sensor histidine kinase YesM